jgi:protein O-mannosyl-transferase
MPSTKTNATAANPIRTLSEAGPRLQPRPADVVPITPGPTQQGTITPDIVTPSNPRALVLLRMMQIPLICIFLAFVTAAIYAPVVRHDFIDYDDDVYVYNNTHVNTGLSWQAVKWAFTSDAAGNWHPLTWISHALDCELYGLNRPSGHHATSLLLHLYNVALLFLFLSWVTKARGRSFVVAALFALHPFNVESVAWVAERKNVLCTLFFLLALLAYAWYAKRPDVKRYLCVAALFVLGLLSKPMVITLPFVLLLLDFWPLGRVQDMTQPSSDFPVAQVPLYRLLLEKLPLLALAGASAVITMIAQRRGNAVVSFSDSPLPWRLQNAVWAYATYLWKAFLPWGLAPFYPTMPFAPWQVALAAIFLLAVGCLIWRLRSGRPYLAFGYLWFLGMLVPVIGIVQIGSQSMADRYAYIPLIGIFVAVVWGIFGAARSDTRRLAAFAAIGLLVLAVATAFQLSYWKNSVKLWTHALKVTVPNFVAEEDLAVGLANLGRDDEALPHFMIAKDIRPTDPIALVNIGINLEKHGRHQEAIQEFETVIKTNHDPDHLTEAHRRAGVIYAQLGDRAKARDNLIQALQFSPDDPVILQNLSMLEIEDGLDKMSKSVLAHPTAEGYFQLGQFLEEDRNIPDARKAYENALKLDPNLTAARNALGILGAEN